MRDGLAAETSDYRYDSTTGTLASQAGVKHLTPRPAIRRSPMLKWEGACARGHHGQAGLAGIVKLVAGAVGGPGGYAVGHGVDVVTTGASALYDYNRTFGQVENYVSVGVAITSTDSINGGDFLIIVWP